MANDNDNSGSRPPRKGPGVPRKPGGKPGSKPFRGRSSGGGKGRPQGGRPSGGRPSKGRPSGGRPPRGGGENGRPDRRSSGSDRPPAPRLSPAQTARQAAMLAVVDVLGKGFRLEGSLARNEALQALDARDRAFARAITATTLRRLGQIDAVLAPRLERPPPGRVKAALQTATAQMIFMDVAPHAAVGDCVAILKADRKMSPFAGLANAVLRNVAETGKADAAKTPPISNIPGWLRADWTKQFGKSEVRRMALMLSQSPPLDLSVKSDPQKWAETLGGRLVGGTTVRLDDIGNVRSMPGYDSGDWWAQDYAASLPAILLNQLAETHIGGLKDAKVADLCAAPGGKTQQLFQFGADVTAIDLSEARTDRLRQNVQRTGVSAEIITADILEYEPNQQFKAILLDAPCSATGTFRRHPDVLHNRRPKDITPLTRLQDRLLARAAEWVEPDGILLYAVCSLQDREGSDRIRAFLKKRSDFSQIALPEVAGLELAEERKAGGALRLLPIDGSDPKGLDGFFIAALMRR